MYLGTGSNAPGSVKYTPVSLGFSFSVSRVLLRPGAM